MGYEAMIKKCPICERLFHEGDKITAIVSSVYHDVDSSLLYAIEQPSACYQMAHEHCLPGEEAELK